MFSYYSAMPEYYWQKPHYNLGNKIIHSDAYKKINPVRQVYEYNNGDFAQMPWFLGHLPQFNWIYGNLDYSYNKSHKHIQGHDEWYPDRKNKSLGHIHGGFNDQSLRASKGMTLQGTVIPRGCMREIRKYNYCSNERGAESCFNEKISIMEVCPDHIL